MIELFHTLFYQPLLNALVFFYNLIPDIGVAIIFLTILIKTILWPLTASMYKAQKRVQMLQPEMKKIQETFKNDRAGQTRAVMELYQKEKVNPLSSCLPLLIQFPFLIALYRVFRTSLDPTKSLPLLYAFVQNPGHLSPYFLTFLDLSVPSIPIAVVTGIAQYFQTKMLPRIAPQANVSGSSDEKMTAALNRQMLYFMPVMTLVIGMTIPAGLTFYWLITTLITIAQQWLFFKSPAQR